MVVLHLIATRATRILVDYLRHEFNYLSRLNCILISTCKPKYGLALVVALSDRRNVGKGDGNCASRWRGCGCG